MAPKRHFSPSPFTIRRGFYTHNSNVFPAVRALSWWSNSGCGSCLRFSSGSCGAGLPAGPGWAACEDGGAGDCDGCCGCCCCIWCGCCWKCCCCDMCSCCCKCCGCGWCRFCGCCGYCAVDVEGAVHVEGAVDVEGAVHVEHAVDVEGAGSDAENVADAEAVASAVDGASVAHVASLHVATAAAALRTAAAGSGHASLPRGDRRGTPGCDRGPNAAAIGPGLNRWTQGSLEGWKSQERPTWIIPWIPQHPGVHGICVWWDIFDFKSIHMKIRRRLLQGETL